MSQYTLYWDQRQKLFLLSQLCFLFVAAAVSLKGRRTITNSQVMSPAVERLCCKINTRESHGVAALDDGVQHVRKILCLHLRKLIIKLFKTKGAQTLAIFVDELQDNRCIWSRFN